MFKKLDLRPINIASLLYGVFLSAYAIYWQIAMYSIYTSKGLEEYWLSGIKYFLTMFSWWKMIGFPFLFGMLFILFGLYGSKLKVSRRIEKTLFIAAFLIVIVATSQSLIIGFVGLLFVSFAAIIQISFYEGRT